MKFITKENHPLKGQRYNHPRKSEFENDLLYEIRMNGFHDAYGVAIGAQFSIAGFLHYHYDAAPDEWDYSPGSGDGLKEDDYLQETIDEFIEATDAEELSDEQIKTVLVNIGNTMSRLVRKCKSAGKELPMKGMRLIAENQEVGDGLGWFVIRDLYEAPSGRFLDRVSIPKTTPIDETKERGTSIAELLKKYPLPKS